MMTNILNLPKARIFSCRPHPNCFQVFERMMETQRKLSGITKVMGGRNGVITQVPLLLKIKGALMTSSPLDYSSSQLNKDITGKKDEGNSLLSPSLGSNSSVGAVQQY